MGRNKSFYQACEDGDVAAIHKMIKDGFKINCPNPLDGFTGLHYAADAGNLEVVRTLLQTYNAGVDKTGPDGGSPLHWAIRTPGRDEIIKCLLDHGADPNLQGKFGRAPVHICANKGLTKNLQSLVLNSKTRQIDTSISDNIKDPAKGTTALHLAATNGHEDCVRALLFENPQRANIWARNGKQQLPLHVACTQNKVNIVRMLVECCGDPGGEDALGAVDAEGRAPLLYACLHNNVDVVKYLTELSKSRSSTDIALGRAVNVNFATATGETALHCAAAGGMKDIIDLLINAGADKTCTTSTGLTPLHLACQHGHVDAAHTITNYDVDTESKDVYGETPLMTACRHNDTPDIARMLLDGAGANHTAHDHRGETAVHAAVMRNKVEVLRYLMTKMNTNKIDDDIDNAHNTPLHLAAKQGFQICFELLMKTGYEISKWNKKGKTAVHLAAAEGRNETLQVIVDSKPGSVNFEDKHSNTPLHMAAKHGQTTCCRILLSADADPNKPNMRGVTPLHFGAESGCKSVVRVLLDAGANVNAVDVNEESALHYSARAGEEGTTSVLIENRCDLTRYNQQGDNALLTAIRNNNENIVALLVQCDEWKEALKVQEENKQNSQEVDVDEPLNKSMVILDIFSNGERTGDAQLIHSDPLHQLIVHYPHQARAVFDRCTDADDTISEEKVNYWVQFDYSLIERGEDQPLHPFTTMLDHDRIQLLDHPLISSLITYKWNMYGRNWCYLNVVLNVIFVTFITAYAMLEIPPGSSDHRPKTALFVLSIGAIVFSLLRLIMELLQAIRNTTSYFTDPLNYLEVTAFVFAIVFTMSIFWYSDDQPSYFQWEVGCFVVVLAWTNMLMSLKKLPYIGIYVIMIGILIKSFLAVVLPILLFTIPFALTFYMNLGASFGTFRTPWYSIVKIMTMFTGEINFDMYLIPPSFTADNPVEFPYSTYVLYICFLFLCPIILMNLLTGLAILDVAETRKTSKLLRSAQRIDQIFLAEKLPNFEYSIPSHPWDKLFPNKLSWRGVSPFDFRGNHIMEILSRRRQVENEGNKKLKKIQSQLSQVIENQTQLKAKINVVYSLLGHDINADIPKIKASLSRIVDKE